MGKHTTHIIKKSATRSTQLIKVIHTDICGHFDTPWVDKNYLIIFIDDYSQYEINIYCIKDPSQ